MTGWHFRTKSAQEMNQTPRHGELFDSNEDLDQQSLLVRETLQNAIDARLNPSNAVVVTYRLGTIERPADDRQIVEMLAEPSRRIGLADAASAGFAALDKPMRYLVVEDFFTSGLDGDVKRWKLGGSDEKEGRFFYFWRNIGRSGKSEDSLGSWGLGKAVFYKASRAGTYFGTTHRSSDGRNLLMGLALVGAHEIDGSQADWYGYWGEAPASDIVPVLPTENRSLIEAFHERFNVSRNLDSQSGLSVVVPWLDDNGWHEDPLKPDWSARSLARAAIEQFYIPVLQGKLILEFNDERDSYVVTHESIGDIGREVGAFQDADDVERTLALAQRYLGGSAASTVVLPALPLERPGMGRWHGTPEFDRMKQIWENEGFLIVQVPHPLRSSGHGNAPDGSFVVVLERDDNIARGRADFFREGMKVPGIRANRFTRARALVLVPGNSVGTMLGEAENPAHTKWSREKRFDDAKYKYRESNIEFVTKAPAELQRLLEEVAMEKDRTALRDLFPRRTEIAKAAGGGGKRPRPGGKGGARAPQAGEPVPDLPPRRPTPFRIDQHASGFRVSSTEDGPEKVRVQMGYDTKGDAFKLPKAKSWLDFDLAAGAIQVTGENVEWEIVAPNELMLTRVGDGPYHVALAGFDVHRDLTVRTVRVPS